MPTRRQHVALEGCLERERLLYNAALHERRVAWYLEQRRVETMDQWRSLARVTGSGATARNSMAFWTLTRVQQTFQRVYASDGGLPRFKPKSRWASFGFSGWQGIDLTPGPRRARLAIQGMPGAIRVHLHRPLPAAATPRAAVLTRGVKGWTLGVQFEITEHATTHPNADKAIGVDAGVLRLASLSDGTCIDNPRVGAAAAAEARSRREPTAPDRAKD